MFLPYGERSRIIWELSQQPWKTQLLLMVTTPLFVCFAICVLIALAIVVFFGGLASGLAIVATTWLAVTLYADTLTYPGMIVVCIGAAWLFAKTREQKPRRFFDWLARGGFWYFSITAFFLCLASFTWLIQLYGWTMTIAGLLITMAVTKAVELAFQK